MRHLRLIILCFFAACVSVSKFKKEQFKANTSDSLYQSEMRRNGMLSRQSAADQTQVQTLTQRLTAEQSTSEERLSEANNKLLSSQKRLDSALRTISDLEVINTSKPESIKRGLGGPSFQSGTAKHQKHISEDSIAERISKAHNRAEMSNVVFYCPRRLKEGETEKVFASLSMFANSRDIKTAILGFVNDVRRQRSQDTITEEAVMEKKLNLLDSVDIELEDPSGRIEVLAEKNQVAWRLLPDSSIEDWAWYITPKKGEGGKASVSLYLNVFTKRTGQDNPVFSKAYIVQVELPETIWQAFLRKMRDIGWVCTIIGGVIGFLAGKWKKRPDQPAIAGTK